MSVSIRILNKRVRSVRDMRHHVDVTRSSGQRSGKWHSSRTLWAYWKKRKQANKLAARHRRQNRLAA